MQAAVNQRYYPQLDIKLDISLPQNLSWAVRNSSPILAQQINTWLTHFKRTTTFALLFDKYYNSERSTKIVNSNYYAITTGRISVYDNEIKQYSAELNWDWRLVAALIYQESNFNMNVSHGSAYGLMQVIPETAKRFGIDSADTPVKNIKVGIKYLKWLDQKFVNALPDDQERVKFVLAAYNVGIGHVFDARALAVKYGKNPNKWDDVKFFLLHKNESKYYKDPESKFGYCRGYITCAYVSEVLNRFSHYKNLASVN
jgi:membrane-bound lytic murein transglycosylase F